MVHALLFVALIVTPGCIAIRVESVCADTKIDVNLPQGLGLTTCSTSHEMKHPSEAK